jgi:hypothetical protein
MRRPTRTGRGVLVWENPPVDNEALPAVDVDHTLVAATLRQWPGRWGVLSIGDRELFGVMRSLARQIDDGYLAAYKPRGAYEAAVRRTGGGARLYARYIGHLNDDTSGPDLRQPGQRRRR